MPHKRLLTGLMAGIFVAVAAFAEPATPPGDEVEAVKLDYGNRPDKDGQFASVEATVGDTPVRYYARGTNVSAPFSVQVIAASLERPLEVTLHRQNWGKVVHSGSTGRAGSFVFEGRAHGDVGVQLTSPGGAPARATLVFWQGAPAAPSMARVYITPEMADAGISATSQARDKAGGQGRGASPVLYVIAGLLAVIVVFLGVMMLRRGKGGAVAAVLIGGLMMASIHDPAPAYAQGEEAPPGGDAPNPFAVDKPLPEVPRDKDKDASAGKPDQAPNPFDVDKPLPDVPRDKDKDASAGKPEDKPEDSPPNPFAGEPTSSSGRPIDLKPEDFDPSNAPKDDASSEDAGSEDMGSEDAGPAPVDEDYGDRLAEADRRIEDLNRQASANRAEIERLRMLLESDREMEPDPSNLPPMPLTCRPPAVDGEDDEEMSSAWDDYDACEACYREPFRELDDLLLNYERLRIIYMSTADFVSTAITMGDTVPKPHQFVEMSWAQQKADIQKSFQGTKDAYDAKRSEFNAQMTEVLDELGRCEAEHNNNPMWRSTEGEMFYRTIRASYQRTN
ncbi:hypothetical protein HNE_1433 [Hyphomonas neptunium ATCC 15444]|uniref:Lipoprotein n=2 Tax=Hyphomonas TaxID=85 RepID=Q0C294_HYPNA|nr:MULTISPECIES: hypothetical protein [Hyphomonas]ABI78182.1 hypothetical protein HNE_1433 [Hyphomonas neptunium ATCC 15444]KCZ93139.1 hypothetical protein HHI_10659 [Hyphomonas hirschiana VP5]